MGAWGPNALDSDQALDWLADICDAAGEETRALINRFNKRIEREGGETEWATSEYAHELRAAGYVVVSLNFFNSRYGDLHGDLALALRQVLGCSDWIDSWTNPEEVKAALTKEIEALKEGPKSTTLFENLDKNA